MLRPPFGSAHSLNYTGAFKSGYAKDRLDIVQSFMVTSELDAYTYARKMIANSLHPEGLEKNINLDNQNYFEEKNINVHYIAVTTDVLPKSIPDKGIFGFNMVHLFWADPSLSMINQILFTFYRNPLYVFEDRTGEPWSWTIDNFIARAPSKIQDYEGKQSKLVMWEIGKRFTRIFVAIFAFFLISTMTAIMIRIAVRCALILIYPCLWCENLWTTDPQRRRRMIARRS